MFVDYSAQTFTNRMPRFAVQRPQVRRAAAIPGGKQLWMVVGRFGLILFLGVAFIQFLLGFYLQSVQKNIVSNEAYQYELAGQHIALRAQRAALLTPQHIEEMAGAMLSLHIPEKGQVQRYNAKKGRFETL